MLIAHYIGNHAKDTWPVRAGWALTRLGQKGAYKQVTHCEAILDENPDGTVTIASASMRDGGVRIKHNVTLTPGNWLITEIYTWDYFNVHDVWKWFEAHLGQPYDLRGAVATLLPGTQDKDRWFCNEAVGAAIELPEPHTFTPSQFCAICLRWGEDVTQKFFAERQIKTTESTP